MFDSAAFSLDAFDAQSFDFGALAEGAVSISDYRGRGGRRLDDGPTPDMVQKAWETAEALQAWQRGPEPGRGEPEREEPIAPADGDQEEGAQLEARPGHVDLDVDAFVERAMARERNRVAHRPAAQPEAADELLLAALAALLADDD